MDVILQARLSSKRLPSKVFLKIFDKKMIEYQIERLKQSKNIKRIIISTSNQKSDDPIENFCYENKILFFRGNLNNVSLRFLDTIKKYDLKSFIRICADSPMIDYRIIDKLINIYKNGKYDLVTNKFPRSYPKGHTVEIVNSQSYFQSFKLIKSNSEKENVTQHYYSNFELFKIKNVFNKVNYSKKSHAIDNYSHFIKFRKFIQNNEKLYKKITLRKLIEIY